MMQKHILPVCRLLLSRSVHPQKKSRAMPGPVPAPTLMWFSFSCLFQDMTGIIELPLASPEQTKQVLSERWYPQRIDPIPSRDISAVPNCHVFSMRESRSGTCGVLTLARCFHMLGQASVPGRHGWLDGRAKSELIKTDNPPLDQNCHASQSTDNRKKTELNNRNERLNIRNSHCLSRFLDRIQRGCYHQRISRKRTNMVKGVLCWPDNNSMFRRVSCNMATSKEC
jgi:hypothetical protein